MGKSHYIIPIFVPHEGCPHNCVFCNQSSITGSSLKVNAGFVKDTVKRYLKTIPRERSTIEVSFFGGTFTAINIEKQKELLEVAKSYKDNGYIDYIRLSTRPDYINNAILDNLKKYEVDIIELGIQSLDKDVLLASGRGHSEEDVINASHLIKKYNFELGHQIMVGLPGDDFQKDIETAKKIIKLSPSICRIYPALVIKNTVMEKMYFSGKYNPYTLKEAINICKIIYGMFRVNNINVIRIGLQPTEEISEGKDLVAGPFHPAFRELVEGSLYSDMILSNVDLDYQGEVHIYINEKDVSKLYANKKQFFNDMKKQLATKSIIVEQDSKVERECLIVTMGKICNKLSIIKYLLKKHKAGYLNIL